MLHSSRSGWYYARLDRQEDRELKKDMRNGIPKKQRPKRCSIRKIDPREVAIFELPDPRKSFSWTKAFEDLEKVMPPRVHLVSIQPELNDGNQLAIKMLVAGDSRERVLDLLRRMESSAHFQQTTVEAESQVQNSNDVAFEITALYNSGSPGRKAIMPDLQQTRQKVKTGITRMVVLCVTSVIVLFSPLVGSSASRKEQMDRLWVELKSKNQQVEPLARHGQESRHGAKSNSRLL